MIPGSDDVVFTSSNDKGIPAVLIVCQHFWPESFRVNEIAFSLVERGYHIDVLCGIPNYPLGKYYPGYHYFYPRKEEKNGLHIYRVGEIPQWKSLGSISISLNYFFFPLVAVLNLPRLLGKRYDLVFNYSLTPVFMSFPGLLFSKLKKIPALTYILDYWPDSLFSVIPIRSRFLRSIFGKISRWHYRHSDRIITPSKRLQKKVVDEIGIEVSSTGFLPQSCEQHYEKLIYSKILHEQYDGRFNIVFAGNIGPAQSLELLIPTAQQLIKKQLSHKWRFILVGDGMSRLSLQAAVEASGLSEYIVFAGHKPSDQIPEYHELADVLFVSLAENPLYDLMIPAKIQSYMAAGKPILAAMAGEGAEIIKESASGLVAQPGNPEQLVTLIVDLLEMDQMSLRSMGQSGFNYYKEHFHHQIILDQLEVEIQTCIQSRLKNSLS